MPEYKMEQFIKNCSDMDIMLTEKQLQQFTDYYEILVEWNSFMNLTGITDFDEVLKKHFEDSLSIVKAVKMEEQTSLIDIGTGAGFPGIPLKIVYPHLKVVLLDSLGKRIKFLEHVIEKLELSNIEAIHARAEDYAKNVDYRETFDLAVSRAVANLASLSEYCLPYTKLNGYFVSYKSGKIEEELDQAKKAIQILGGKTEKVEKFLLSGSDMERSLVVVRKTKLTQKKYPRKAGLPSREPIH